MIGKPSILITGGLGNIGAWLTEYFSQDYLVYVLTRNAKEKLPCDYQVVEADITDLPALESALQPLQLDYCIHAASYNEFFESGYPEKALAVNVLGTRNILEVLRTKTIKKFIYFSTFHVYGQQEGVVTERLELNPQNDYAQHIYLLNIMRDNLGKQINSLSLFSG